MARSPSLSSSPESRARKRNPLLGTATSTSRPIIRDEVSLALPLVPLCKKDCLGLCPTCGTDLNTAPCSGHADESDSPFSALQQLLEP